MPDIDSEEAKQSGITSVTGTAAPVSAAAAEPSPPVPRRTTAESRAELVAKLQDLPLNSKKVIDTMNVLKAEGLAPR